MRKLKRRGKGRAAVVVPHGVLFGDGIAARIKADLLKEFNLHTVVRLPEGVFEPYTPIPTNILFFDTSHPTSDVWFYDQPKPEGRRKYSKTAPIGFDEFRPCLEWWNARRENEQAWKIYGPGLIETDESGRVTACNLDLKNPNASGVIDPRAPLEIVESIEAKEQCISAIIGDIKRTLSEILA